MLDEADHGCSRSGAGTPRHGLPGRALLTVGAAVTVVAGLVTSCGAGSDPGTSSSTTSAASTDAESVATDAYIFGYPLVLMDATRESAMAGVPANRIAAVGPIDPTQNSVVMPNVDTVYASAWLDLRTEPVVLQVPEMADRYWLMQIMDAWTNSTHDPSIIAPQVDDGQGAPYTYAITGPDWSGTLPHTMTRLAMPTETAWMLGRIEYRDSADLPAAQAFQRQLGMAPLSAWQRGERPAPVGDPAAAVAVSPPDQVADMDGRTFFTRLNTLMETNPPAAADQPALDRFATIGIEPGGRVDTVSDDLLNAAVETARNRIPAYRNPKARRENGWEFATNLGSYGTDYPLRAATAWTSLGANLPKDAVYPSLVADATDSTGAPQRYRLKFIGGQTPPAQAFWSLTAYTADGYLASNPAGIYSVGHQVPVMPSPDGSVELAIQADDPGHTVPLGNWLPIPSTGEFRLLLRLYGPDRRALDGTWQPPALTPIPTG
ncbi:DUF1254 domain-containing protein [Nocardia uniformis]|uniref:DUF1254 domain-containing protein n=1 Tax=Nocardia uniformis TaxID=53432 RepID=A0A849C4P6_9NOCA|nr:DUF1254 domain-containing protein [Nocardia uniformis]NNH73602.1 DUF1254 domain-containing protein [Nocardia uniformis]